ncbi:probable anion transporter 2, chloroplastic [Phoenix dactylifera]|uniref:Probable anion transporter 2, chloroplastic n=1 Tax=Phoenix dactylifera TaxID=42345 RepID=A0A8B7BU56_PHODC|nr:probable anion transporter 2, chloroplastic [Phoenix dactylifera]
MAVVSPPPSRSIPLSRSASPATSSPCSPSISSSMVCSSKSRRGSRLRIVSGFGIKLRSSPDPEEGGNASLEYLSRGHVVGSVGEKEDERWIGGDGGRRMRRKRRVAVMCSAGLEGIGGRSRELAREEGFVIPERAKLVSLVAMAMCLCNADRVVMSVAIVPLASRYGWSSSVLGIVQSSFLWGYLVSSIVGGALADRYGGKRVLACGVALWSVATFLTPWAADHSTAMLLAVRALFGLAEGVAFPSMSTLLFRWFPGHERATAVAISMAGFHLGNVISFLVSPIILSRVGVNGSFAFFASLGFIWLSSWVFGITNDPRDSPRISQAELHLIRAGKTDSKMEACTLPSVRHLLSRTPSWAVMLANVANNWGYFVLLSWMPVYFKTVYNVNLKQAAWFSAVPWGVMALSGYIAGASSDFLIKSSCSVTQVRKLMQSIGFIGPGVSLLCLKYAQTPTAAAVLMTIALSLSSFSQAGYFLNIQDIAPKYAGFLHGITNSAGTLAAIISTIGTGYFVQWLGSFQAFLTLTAVVYFSTTVFYNLYATAEQVFF